MYLCFFGKVKIRAFKRKPPQTTHPIQNPPSCRVRVCPKLNIWMMRPPARGRTCVCMCLVAVFGGTRKWWMSLRVCSRRWLDCACTRVKSRGPSDQLCEVMCLERW